MTYKEKAAKFKELTYRENRRLDYVKWRNRDELAAYLERWGGRVKEDRRRRRGYLVSVLQDALTDVGPLLVAEVPMEFAEKVLAMNGFP